MLLKLPRCLSDVRAPLVEDLGPPELEKTCCIFSIQITEKVIRHLDDQILLFWETSSKLELLDVFKTF